ncbi:MAG TPA: GNAT family protein, partial [Clostridia bacterium]|nr:GNAT family protein [Clostridia bacterium]
ARELGYVLNERYQRKGYGSAACKAVVDHFFQRGLHRIYAECCPQNVASWKLMEKIGLRREAHFKKNVSFRTDGEGNPVYWDTYVYAALGEEFGRGFRNPGI